MEKVNTPLDPLILCVDSYNGIKIIFKKNVDGSQSDTNTNIKSIDRYATNIKRNLLFNLRIKRHIINLVLENSGLQRR